MATISVASASAAHVPPPADDHVHSEQEEDEEDDEEDFEVDPNAIDHSSWKTATFDNSFGMPLGVEYSAMGGFPMPLPPMMPGMQFGIPMPPWGPMPPPLFNAPATPADLEAQAAHLEAHAQYLKNAARQQQSPAMISAGGAMAPVGFPYPPELSGYAAPEKSKPKRTPASANSRATAASAANSTDKTTIMLRNIPNNYSREMVLELLDNEGFKTKYDFVYLPMDFHRMAGLGYAFINLIDTEAAAKFKAHFHGFTGWTLASHKVCEVSWGEPLQGLQAHIERYRNSPVMHEDVTDKYKPVIFKDGVRQPFPPPTKRIQPPRMKKTIIGKGSGKDAGGEEDGANEEHENPQT